MFIDTNVLVQARFVQAPQYAAARAALERATGEAGPLSISRQVLREYLAVATRSQSWANPEPMEDALVHVRTMAGAYRVLEDGPAVTEILLALLRDVPTAGSQVHDANIVATMLAHGERRLLTFNMSDFRRFEGRVELVIP